MPDPMPRPGPGPIAVMQPGPPIVRVVMAVTPRRGSMRRRRRRWSGRFRRRRRRFLLVLTRGGRILAARSRRRRCGRIGVGRRRGLRRRWRILLRARIRRRRIGVGRLLFGRGGRLILSRSGIGRRGRIGRLGRAGRIRRRVGRVVIGGDGREDGEARRDKGDRNAQALDHRSSSIPPFSRRKNAAAVVEFRRLRAPRGPHRIISARALRIESLGMPKRPP